MSIHKAIYTPTKVHRITLGLKAPGLRRLRSFREDAQSFLEAGIGDADPPLLEVENEFDERPVLKGEPPILRERRVTTPADRQLAYKLAKLRILMLQKERSHFPKVLDLVEETLNSIGVQEPLIEGWRRGWAIPILRDLGAPLDGEPLLQLWFNAEYFHRTDHKIEDWQKLRLTHSHDRIQAWLMLAVAYKHAVIHEFLHWLEAGTDLYVDDEAR